MPRSCRKIFLPVVAVVVVVVIWMTYVATQKRTLDVQPIIVDHKPINDDLMNIQNNRIYDKLAALKNARYTKKPGGKTAPSKETAVTSLPWAPRGAWVARPKLGGWWSGLSSTHIVTDENYLLRYFRRHSIMARQGEGLRVEKATTPIEKWYLATPPLVDPAMLPDEHNSQVRIISPSRTYQVGDTISIRVDLFDKWNRIRPMGGDQLRIWLTSFQSPFSVAAEVVDLGNGSYVGRSVLQWVGLTSVKVSLTYPREFLRYLIWLRHSVHTLRWISASFGDGDNATGVTVCLPSAPVPGFPTTCDLTKQNGGFPWFCGRPHDAPWNCSQWRATGNLAGPVEPPANDLTRFMIRKMNSEPILRTVENELMFFVEPGLSRPRLPPCWTQSKRSTWTSPAPRGWFRNGSWQGQTCAVPSWSDPAAFVQECLRNTRMLMLGDSNMRLWFEAVQRMLGCDVVVNTEQYHEPKTCHVPRLNSTIIYGPHAMPFNVGAWVGVQTLPLTTALREIPVDGLRIVVIVHYFVHLAFYPLDVFRDAVRAARWALQHFLQQHPSATVLVRGPHVMYRASKHPMHPVDASVAWYVSVLREEFRPLYDRVWFLNFEDMTIASENLTSHPPQVTVMEMLKVLLGYVCEREREEVGGGDLIK